MVPINHNPLPFFLAIMNNDWLAPVVSPKHVFDQLLERWVILKMNPHLLFMLLAQPYIKLMA
jgi:hypothetical protein